MDSLPQQHIESLAKPTQKEAREKIALLCVLRNQGREEANIAERLGFGSPESMYRQLEIWGLSGLAPQKEEQLPPARKGPMEAPTPADERRARQGGGEAIKLPSAVDAAPLFRVAINNLTSDVDWYLTELEEVYQDGRFYAMGNNTARGASPYPTVPEICLIAAYVINAYLRGGGWRDVERLVEKLHPEPDKVDREHIEKLLLDKGSKDERLLTTLKKLAKAIRNGPLKPGRNAAPMDMWEQGDAMRIQGAIQQGVPEDEIEHALRAEQDAAVEALVEVLVEQGVPKEEAERVVREQRRLSKEEFLRLRDISPPKL